MEITPGRTGSFEVVRGDAVLYSKLESGQFPTDDEIRGFAGG